MRAHRPVAPAHQTVVCYGRRAHVPKSAMYAHTGRVPIRAHRLHIPIAHTGRVDRPVHPCAHTGRACAYRPRMPAAYTGRCAHTHIPAVSADTGCVYRPVRSCAPTGRCAHGRIPKWYTRAFRPMCTWRMRHPTTPILLLIYNTYTSISPSVTGFLQGCAHK